MKIKDIWIGVTNMSLKLFFEAMIKIILGILLVGLLIFLPAGTFDYFNGWLLMGILFIPMFLAGIVMMIKSPELLKRRLDAKEKLGEKINCPELKNTILDPKFSYWSITGFACKKDDKKIILSYFEPYLSTITKKQVDQILQKLEKDKLRK